MPLSRFGAGLWAFLIFLLYFLTYTLFFFAVMLFLFFDCITVSLPVPIKIPIINVTSLFDFRYETHFKKSYVWDKFSAPYVRF